MRIPLCRLLCALTVLALLAGGAYALSSGDSLISLSYLTDVFFSRAVQAGEGAAGQKLQETYDEALKALDQVHLDHLGQGAGELDPAYLLYSGSLGPREWSDGDLVLLPTGSGFFMLEGTAILTHQGAVVDVTEGTEVASGTRLLQNHRYLVGEDSRGEVTILSGAARMGVQGNYGYTGGGKEATPFYDVSQTDWYYEPVNYVYQNGLFSGMGEHEFSPNTVMNRAMLMTVLYQLAGAPEDELQAAEVSFSDVPEVAWFAPYVKWGAAQGITAGTGEGTFSPDRQITREQLVVLLYSYAVNYLGKTLDLRADLSGYEDLSQASTWAHDGLSWAVAQGIISSSSADRLTLSPQKGASRAEVATMLRAFSEKIL